MADIKISQLGAAIAVGDIDLLPIVSGGNTLKATAAQVKEHSIGNTNISSIGDGSVTGAINALNTDKQPKTLDTPLTIGGVSKTTVEAALDGLVSENQTLTNEAKDMNNVLGAKNMIYSERGTTVDHGITWTKNPNGSWTATGTKDSSSDMFVVLSRNVGHTVPAGEYIFSGKPVGANYRMDLLCTRSGVLTTLASLTYGTTSANVTIQEGDALQISLQIVANASGGGKTFYPMLRPANIVDDTYVPYAKTNEQLTEKAITFPNYADVITTILAQGVSYTATRNCWAIGTVQMNDNYTPIVRVNNKTVAACEIATLDSGLKTHFAVPIMKGQTLTTREDHGAYLIVIYGCY